MGADGKVQKWASRAALLIVPVGCTAAAWILAVWVADEGTSPTQRRWWLVLGALCAGAAILTPALLAIRSQGAARSAKALAEDAEAKVFVALNSALSPSLDHLGKIADTHVTADKRRVLAGQLAQAVVNAAAHLCGREHTRAVFYKLDGPDLLVADCYAGRAEPSTREFRDDPSDPVGVEVFRHIDSWSHRFVPDVGATAAGAGVPPASRTYNTFVTVPVRLAGKRCGMLAIDAPQAGDLVEIDVAYLKVLAQTLAVGWALAWP